MDTLKKIASFQVDHEKLLPGMYVSRVDGDVVTYDIRMVRPNCGRYLENDQLHTFEHLFATCVRSGKYADAIVYAGPMGCRTGFYLLTRDSLPRREAIELTRDALRFIAAWEGEIPGATPRECGNAAEHSLEKAKKLASDMLPALEGWTEEMLGYDCRRR